MDVPDVPEELLARSQRAERAAALLGAVAVGAALLLHSWSASALALRQGPFQAVLLVSDSLARAQSSDAVLLRYDPGAGTADLVSLPAPSVLGASGERRKLGRLYAGALKARPGPEAPAEPQAAAVEDRAQALRLQDATAEAVRLLQEGLGETTPRPYLHLDAAGAALLAGGGPGPDDAAAGVRPGLRQALALFHAAHDGALGPWGALRALGPRARALSDLSRYDLAVLGLEGLGVAGANVRPVQLPAGRRGEFPIEELRRLESPVARARPVQVEVLNAGARAGAAAAVTRRLRERGVDVVYFGNLGRALQRTWVLDRSGDRAAAKELARLLTLSGVEGPRPQAWTVLAPERLLHASVLLGTDLEAEN